MHDFKIKVILFKFIWHDFENISKNNAENDMNNNVNNNINNDHIKNKMIPIIYLESCNKYPRHDKFASTFVFDMVCIKTDIYL